MVMSFNVISLLQGTIVFCATTLGLVLCIKATPPPPPPLRGAQDNVELV